MKPAPQSLPEALDVIRAMHSGLIAFRHPEFDLVAPGREGEFDDRVKAVLAHCAPVIKADRATSLPEASPATKGQCNDERACGACFSDQGPCAHASDCAQHNEPAMPAVPCDCGADASKPPTEDLRYWRRLSALPKYSFLSPLGGGVSRVPDKHGRWVELAEVQEIVDAAENDLHELRERLAMPSIVWTPCHVALPAPGFWLVTVETDDGREVHVLELSTNNKWIHEGEFTFQHGYFFRPIAWAPRPAAYDGDVVDDE